MGTTNNYAKSSVVTLLTSEDRNCAQNLQKSHKNTINLNIGLYIVIKRQLKPQGLNYPSSDLFKPEPKSTVNLAYHILQVS